MPPVESRLLGLADRDAAMRHLARDPLPNLFLLDLVARLGSRPPPGEMPPEIVGAWSGEQLVGLAGLRPSIVVDAAAGPEAVEAFLPYVESLSVGLVKSPRATVETLWRHLANRCARRAVVDRIETAFALRPDRARLVPARPGETSRPAVRGDLDALVIAARESLREEHRPDPFAGDAKGFRRWVRGRVSRARVVEQHGRVVFVGYADVQRPQGWLLQGIYTWPEFRMRGHASVGVSDLCREAFAAGADHVQLAVVEGNAAGRKLYERLGFEPFAALRTILFC